VRIELITWMYIGSKSNISTSITNMSDKQFFAILSCPWHSCPLDWRYYATSLLYQISHATTSKAKQPETPTQHSPQPKNTSSLHQPISTIHLFYLLTYLSFHNHGALRKNPPNILPRPPASPIHHISPSGPDLASKTYAGIP
jgi:hypothetical protein